MTSIIITPEGRVRHIYSDDLVEMDARLGFSETKRVSNVEPGYFTDGITRWFADMSPVGGSVLGPFNTRAEALACEVNWLERNNLPAVTS